MQLSLISILTDFLRIMFAIVIGFIACVLRTLCIDSVLIVGECDTDDAASIATTSIHFKLVYDTERCFLMLDRKKSKHYSV